MPTKCSTQKRWLAEEASNLATRFPHLDEIPSRALLPLAKLVADGASNAGSLTQALEIDADKLDEYLDALCKFNLVEKTFSGYKATAAGEQAFEVVSRTMVKREVFEMDRRLKHLRRLRERFDGRLKRKVSREHPVPTFMVRMTFADPSNPLEMCGQPLPQFNFKGMFCARVSARLMAL